MSSSETDLSPQPTDAASCSRRDYLERVGVTAGTLVTLGAAGDRVAPQFSPIGRAEAIAPIVVAAGAGIAVGWALREFEVVGSDDPPEGLTASALEYDVYETALTRESTNASSVVDNQNILEGIDHAAYGDGKIAAIEKLNEGATQQAVQDAATAAVDSYETTVLRNMLKTWNEAMNELENLLTSISDHPDLTHADRIAIVQGIESDGTTTPFEFGWFSGSFEADTYTLPDGTTIDVKYLRNDTSYLEWSPLRFFDDGTYGFVEGNVLVTSGSDEVVYLESADWEPFFTEAESTFESVRNGLITWVDTVYSEVQEGELDPTELLTPRELAEMTADDEEFNQAVADLMALNLSVDLEREATISLSEIDATIQGQLAVSGDTTIRKGDTIDPSADNLSYYFTYDISKGEGTWSAYDDSRGIDGGNLYFTSEPFEETLYQINTAAGETATVTAADFTAIDADGNEVEDWENPAEWVVDLSDQLEDSITDVGMIRFFADTEETQFETIQLQQTFTVEKIEDSEGNEFDSMSVASAEAHDDTNYLSEEEWAELEARQQELIEKYEDAQSGGVMIPGFGEVSPGGAIAGAIAIFGGAAAFSKLTN